MSLQYTQQNNLENMIEAMHGDFELCDCKGTPSEPWNYCDDCQEYRNLLEEASK